LSSSRDNAMLTLIVSFLHIDLLRFSRSPTAAGAAPDDGGGILESRGIIAP
jgi:hypothetical protein